jgi:hypothetical protein
VGAFFPKVLDGIAIFIKAYLWNLTLTLTLGATVIDKVFFKR